MASFLSKLLTMLHAECSVYRLVPDGILGSGIGLYLVFHFSFESSFENILGFNITKCLTQDNQKVFGS